MRGGVALAYRVLVTKDPETRQGMAGIPTLQIADFGADAPEGPDHLRATLTFHLECLREGGKPIPADKGGTKGSTCG